MSTLSPLPPQPPDAPWPTQAWPRADLAGAAADARAVEALYDHVFSDAAHAALGRTFALLVVRGGQLVAERYSPEHDAESTLHSWSMSKSMLHAVIGTLVAAGRLDVDAPADVPAWQGEGDPRAAITVDQLLRMESGLEFFEDYVDERTSDAIAMLFGAGKEDVAGYATDKPLAHPPGTWWNYSSGTSNVLAALVQRRLGLRGEAFVAHLRAVLFDRIGMRSALPKLDPSGTWIASSFTFATARDFARFGLLCLRDGVWAGDRILPAGWIDYARTPTLVSDGWYGAHFWVARDGSGVFTCNGFQGQYIVIDPARDLVVVRLGQSQPEQKGAIWRSLRDLLRAFPERAPQR